MTDKIKTKEEILQEIAGISANSASNGNYRGTQTPGSGVKKRKKRLNKLKKGQIDIRKDKITNTSDITFKTLAERVEKFVPNSAKALKITLAVASSGSKKGSPMLWMMLVGTPSSGKTEIATLVKKSTHVYPVDSMTLSSFVTGERETKTEKVHDLLPSLNEKCFLIKDWTALFSLNEEITKKLIGDLVNIYDEEFVKFSPGRGNVTYRSKFAHIGCITPATLNKHTRYLNMIGARFLFYAVPTLSREQRKKSFDSIFQSSRRTNKKKRLMKLASKFLNRISKLSIKKIRPLSPEVQGYLQVSAEFIAKARGIVIIQQSSFKNDEGENITYYEPLDVQIEEPWRAVQQLIRLSKYLTLVEEKDEVGIEEMEIIKDITLSSMPADRAQALSIFKDPFIAEVTAANLADYSEKSPKTARRLLDELVYLGILEKDKGIGTMATTYKLKEEFKNYVSLATTEFLSSYSDETEAKTIAEQEDLIKKTEEIFINN